MFDHMWYILLKKKNATKCPIFSFWYYWVIRVLLGDKGCITQLKRLGDLGNKLGDLPPRISQNYPNHPFGAANRSQKGSLLSLAYFGWQIIILCPAGPKVGWLVGWLVGWSVGLVGWLVGRLVG